MLPVEVEPPDGVVERLRTHCHFGGECLFGQVLQGARHLEVFREVVLPVHSEHGFPFLRVVTLAFKRHVDRRSSIDDALVEDGHLARAVVYGVVGSFRQGDASGRYDHRSLWHVVGAEGYDIGRRALVLSLQEKLVFLGNLLCHGLRRVVELRESIGCRLAGRHACADETVVEVASERLGLGEEHASVAHGVAFHVVEVAVWVRLVVVVKAVSPKELDERLVFDLLFGYVRKVNSSGVALVFHVELEFLAFHG